MAAKNLVIVESPAKARTLEKYLGRDFQVKASVGHVVDLPKSKLGVDVKKNFAPDFTVIQAKKKVIDELKKAAKGKENIYLASDPDREGEAIAWHIAGQVVKNHKHVHRVLFNEITKKAVLEAIANPLELDRNKFDAQVARRVLDRLVGYKISPLLWTKVRRGLSAGRVQSVAVRLVCEREKDIRAFEPVEYWSLTALLEGRLPPSFKAKLVQWKDQKVDNKKFRLENDETVQGIIKSLDGASWVIGDVEKKERRRFPTSPFVTSKLQQEAARKLGFQPKRTMQLAQQLYEGVELGSEGSVGLITYMRTDSTRVSNDALDAVRQHIQVSIRQKLRAGQAQYVSLEERHAGCPRSDSADLAGIHPGARAPLLAARHVSTLFADLGPFRRQPNGAGSVRSNCLRDSGQRSVVSRHRSADQVRRLHESLYRRARRARAAGQRRG